MPLSSLYEPYELLASAARTATGNGDAVRLLEGHRHVRGVVLTLDVTAAATESGDTLDVAVQVKLDGTNWVDVAAFTQVLGNGGPKRYHAKIIPALAQDDFEAAASLSAGEVRNLLAQEMRVRWAITDASTDNASFTFKVTATLI